MKCIGTAAKPARPTPLNERSAGPFHKDTKMRIKIVRYCEVLQRGGSYVYERATKEQRVTALAHTAHEVHHKKGT